MTVQVAAAPLVVRYQEDVRTRLDGAEHTPARWLVETRLARVAQAP